MWQVGADLQTWQLAVLPDGGVFDFVDRFMVKNPGYVDLSDRAFRSWAIASGVESKEEGCRDDLEISFEVPALAKSVKPMLGTLAMLNNSDLLKSFPSLSSTNCCAMKTVVLD